MKIPNPFVGEEKILSAAEEHYFMLRENQQYRYWMNVIEEKQFIKPPQWAVDFVERCKVLIHPDVEVHMVPCLFVFPMSTPDTNDGRNCAHRLMPCVQLEGRIFMPMPVWYTNPEEWKQALLHEYAHILPDFKPYPVHNESFHAKLKAFCHIMGVEYGFSHILGIVGIIK